MALATMSFLIGGKKRGQRQGKLDNARPSPILLGASPPSKIHKASIV